MVWDQNNQYEQDGWALTQQYLSGEHLRGAEEAEHYSSYMQSEPGQALSIDTEGAAGYSLTSSTLSSEGVPGAGAYGVSEVSSNAGLAGVSLNSGAGQQAALSTSGEHAPKFGAAEPVSTGDTTAPSQWQEGAKQTQDMLNWFYGMHD